MNNAIIGQSDFKNIRKANAYYVDKSQSYPIFVTAP
ncbi:hypothetical protein MHK_000829 [Candidatus Magnetomorum sp. HK-1]|nr:hypothetical protein MHK_000829 [Candidatus Magnetomorum sp. HK-1]